jgi:hypothetical protein
MGPFTALFEASQKDGKGLYLYLRGGHTLGLAVTSFTESALTGRNQQHGVIVVKTEEIVAVARP